jgi:hypothetical protein
MALVQRKTGRLSHNRLTHIAGVQRNTAGETLKRVASDFTCRVLSSRLPFSMADTMLCPKDRKFNPTSQFISGYFRHPHPEPIPFSSSSFLKMSSLRFSPPRNGSNSLKTRPTLNPTHSPPQTELKTSFHQATL